MKRSFTWLVCLLSLSVACDPEVSEEEGDNDGDGYTVAQGDCDDVRADIYPGADEICDDLDNDCDGLLDEEDNNLDWSTASDFYTDADGDGYGNPSDQVLSCYIRESLVENMLDCDDSDPELNADDLDGDGYSTCDNDCDDTDAELSDADEDGDGYSVCDGDCDDLDAQVSVEDLDGDGFSACGDKLSIDCDDTDALTFPGSAELESDEACMSDTDEDGWGDAEPAEGIEAGTDCDDSDPSLNQNDEDADGQSSCDGDCLDSDGHTYVGAAINEDAELCTTDSDSDGWGSSDPAEGAEAGNDCDDSDTHTHPGAAEEESATACMRDRDDDGFGDDSPSEGIETGTDCSDDESALNPAAEEICDELDNDCDGLFDAEDSDITDAQTFYLDADGDGYGDEDTPTAECALPSGYSAVSGDCDDGDKDISPGATEICDALDNDCDGDIDDEDSSVDLGTSGTLFYADTDSDGYGDAGSTSLACAVPSGFVTNAQDCDDGDTDISPAAVEVCDEIDNDCDGDIDDDDANLDDSSTSTWYADLDNDGFGSSTYTLEACVPSSGYVDNDEDCDDGDGSISPDATEICDDVDNDCNEAVDDEDTGLDPSSTLTWYVDYDGDGYGRTSFTTTACLQPSGYTDNDLDCDDTESSLNLDDSDGDGYSTCDDDCDDDDATLNLDDVDGDGYSTCDDDCDDTESSLNLDDVDGDGYSTCDGDCDDDDASRSLNDLDGDGYNGCSGDCNDTDSSLNLDDSDGDGYSTCDGDCDDNDDSLNLDDLDGDGYSTCDDDCDDEDGSLHLDDSDGDGYSTCDDDCDDTSAAVYPGASDSWYDGVDSDCDGANDYDADSDGYDSLDYGGADCDDTDDTVYPLAGDTRGDSVDQDCDDLDCESGWIDDVYFVVCLDGEIWSDAKSICEASGYDSLATVTSNDENDMILDLHGGTGVSNNFVWLGYSDQASEGTWVWSSGSSSTYTNWNSGQPSDGSTSRPIEDCALMRPQDGTWDDRHCNDWHHPSTSASEYGYACESR